MKPNIKVITLGVDDLHRSLRFYRDGLGLPTEGIVGTEFEDGAVVFFHLDGGLVLALYPRPALPRERASRWYPPRPEALLWPIMWARRRKWTRLCGRPRRPVPT